MLIDPKEESIVTEESCNKAQKLYREKNADRFYKPFKHVFIFVL